MRERDSQKQRVYDWEDKYIGSKHSDIVVFDNVQSIIDYVWNGMGLEYPPKAILLSKTARKGGSATRLHVRLQPVTRTWIILHELAHSMTSDEEDNSDRHNAQFVGVYMKLLEKFLNIPSTYLWWSATESKVKFDRFATPIHED